MSADVSVKSRASAVKKRGGKKKKRINYIAVICGSVVVTLAAAAAVAYFAGKAYYSDKFLANTAINGIDVSKMTYNEACEAMGADNVPETLTVTSVDGQKFVINTCDFDYALNYREEIKKLFESVNRTTWFSGWINRTDYYFSEEASYDAGKLENILKETDWGESETTDAVMELGEDGYFITKEVQGNKVTDMDKLCCEVEDQLSAGSFETSLDEYTGCYDVPAVTAADLQSQCDNYNKLFNMSIGIDFNYTTETLTGTELMSMLDVDDAGNYMVLEDKVMEYVEKLAEKYDTYNTERKFHATLQGDIVIPTSDDARYGWWIDQQQTCDAIVDALEEGESLEDFQPIYYTDPGGYEYTGVASARTAEDDIGDTYIEIDLIAQHLWYYEKGELQIECDIVSGQTTSIARTTLPGVYKIWYKATNYRMKDTNADGESWDTTCNYWNRVAICGIGLHDTVTRTAFGGNIYKYNGSHGCINMPLWGAKYVYENVDMGTPVVMYYSSAESSDE